MHVIGMHKGQKLFRRKKIGLKKHGSQKSDEAC
jgi:hypothetical protein